MALRANVPYLPWMLLLVTAAWGCQASRLQVGSTKPLPSGSTHLIHLPGIAGDTPFDRWWMDALAEGGAADRAELYDWTCNRPGIDALQAYARNRQQALKVAELIQSRSAEDPRGRIILTAESGGAGVAVWALERLPAKVVVDDVLLIAPAVSPAYDLSAALRHVRGKMYYFSSTGDWFVLGVGTSMFGTMDGRRSNAAGFVGFSRPESADAGQYAKLVEMRYDSVWMQWGDFGNHTGGMSPSFARHFLAPLLLRDHHEELHPIAPQPQVASVHHGVAAVSP